MWPTVMQLAFCGQLVFRTSVNTKRLRADCYKEITLRHAVIVGIAQWIYRLSWYKPLIQFVAFAILKHAL